MSCGRSLKISFFQAPHNTRRRSRDIFSKSPLSDVLIIGGGPSGLSTALGLVEQLCTAVVFDSGAYRDAATQYMHMFLSWDHQSAAAFRAATKADILARYSTIRFHDVVVENVSRPPEGLFWRGTAQGMTG